jgi:hypothetical protein
MNHGAGGAIYAGIGSLISFNIGGSTTFDDAERGARYGVYGCNVNALSKASIAGIGFSSYKWMAYFATKIQASLLLFGGSSVQNHIINPEPGPQNILIRWVSMDSGGVHPSGYNFCVNARCQNFYNGTATGNSTGGQLCVDACSFADSAQGLGSGNQGNVPPPSNWGHFDGVVFQRNRFTRMQDYAMYTTASLNMTFRDNQLWNVGSLSNLDGLATLSILMYRNRYYRPAGLIPQYGTPSVGSIDNGILYLGGSTLPNAQVQEFTDNLIQDMRDTTTNDNAGILQFPWANHVGKSFFDRNTYYTPTVGTSANTMIDNSTYKTFAAWKADDPNFDPNSVQTNPGWPSPSTGDFGPYF